MSWRAALQSAWRRCSRAATVACVQRPKFEAGRATMVLDVLTEAVRIVNNQKAPRSWLRNIGRFACRHSGAEEVLKHLKRIGECTNTYDALGNQRRQCRPIAVATIAATGATATMGQLPVREVDVCSSRRPLPRWALACPPQDDALPCSSPSRGRRRCRSASGGSRSAAAPECCRCSIDSNCTQQQRRQSALVIPT